MAAAEPQALHACVGYPYHARSVGGYAAHIIIVPQAAASAADAQVPGRGAPAIELPPGPPPRSKGLLSTEKHGLAFFLDPFRFVGGRFAEFGDMYYAPSGGAGSTSSKTRTMCAMCW